MSSSKPTATARLVVRAPNLAEVSIVDANLTTAASGLGTTDAQLAPGVYRVSARFGNEIRQNLVALDADEDREISFDDIAFQSAAPVTGTLRVERSEQEAVTRATQKAPLIAGTQGQLVLFVRNVNRDAEVSPENALASIQLMNERSEPVMLSAGRRQISADGSWVSLTLPLEEGGYFIRVIRPTRRTSVLDQSVWIPRGWTTVMFIPTRQILASYGPDRNRVWVPAPESASVHMLRVGDTWNPDNLEMSRENLALESALSELRQGRRMKSRQLEDLLLNGKFMNPMLGIVGAHGLLLSREPALDRLRVIVGNLGALMHGSPDVAALRFMVATRGGTADAEPAPISWPPMLAAGFRAVVEADRLHPGRLVANSLAERAASRLLSGPVWSTWQPTDVGAAKVEEPTLGVTWMPRKKPGDTSADTAAETILLKLEAALGTQRGAELNISSLKANAAFLDALHTLSARGERGTMAFRNALADARSDDPGIERLRKFLVEMLEYARDQDFNEFIGQLDARTLSESTGIPMRPVSNLLAIVKSVASAS